MREEEETRDDDLAYGETVDQKFPQRGGTEIVDADKGEAAVDDGVLVGKAEVVHVAQISDASRGEQTHDWVYQYQGCICQEIGTCEEVEFGGFGELHYYNNKLAQAEQRQGRAEYEQNMIVLLDF